MRFRRFCSVEEPEINFIPFIDIMLVILIFLMALISYTQLSHLNIHLPHTHLEPSTVPTSTVHIMIDANNHYFINNKKVKVDNPTAFAHALQKTAKTEKNPHILIHADKKCTYQAIIYVMEALQLAGFFQLTFATQSPPLP